MVIENTGWTLAGRGYREKYSVHRKHRLGIGWKRLEEATERNTMYMYIENPGWVLVGRGYREKYSVHMITENTGWVLAGRGCGNNYVYMYMYIYVHVYGH